MFIAIKSIATMNINIQYFSYLILTAGIWAAGNELLHDVFILLEHKGPYDRQLLRLLMDGHILITSGILYILAFFLLKQNLMFGLYLCVIISLSMLIYCGMIFPFLKSVITIAINLGVLILSILKLSDKL